MKTADREEFMMRLRALDGMLQALGEDCDGQTGEPTVAMVWGVRDYLTQIIEDAESLLWKGVNT